MKNNEIMKYICIAFIKFYQKFLSSAIRSNCKFCPTCSNYAVEAIKKHGSLKGVILSIYRILRCNPFSKGGFDPVPDNFKGDLKWVL